MAPTPEELKNKVEDVWRLKIRDLIKAVDGEVVGRCKLPLDFEIKGIGTDTRKELKEKAFIALKGDQYDAHDFLGHALESGASVLILHKIPTEFKAPDTIMVIQVKDTLKALQNLAGFWRKKNKFTVLGVTGSNGKTSTKEFARAILEPEISTYASLGSLNNHWGVPMSLLSAGPHHKVIIQEMGMNHSGEITELAKIARPDVTVVTMVGQSHIGELGSQLAVAQAKEELYLAEPQSIQIFNIDNEFTIEMHKRSEKAKRAKRWITFSSFRKADVVLRAEKLLPLGIWVTGEIQGVKGQVEVPVVGRHNVTNLMAASAMALAIGIKPEVIWKNLPLCRSAWGRNQVVTLKQNTKVLFDGYNANPESMAAAIKNLFEMDCQGQKVAVLGEMKELGALSVAAHRELGGLVARCGFDIVWFMGEHYRDFKAGIETEGFSKTLFVSEGYEEALALKVRGMLNPNDIAVIKGSRSMKMEQVLLRWDPVDFKLYS